MPLDRGDRSIPAPPTPAPTHSVAGTGSAGAAIPAPAPAPARSGPAIDRLTLTPDQLFQSLYGKPAPVTGTATGQEPWQQAGFASKDDARDAVNPFSSLPTGAAMGPGYTAEVTLENTKPSGIRAEDLKQMQREKEAADAQRGMQRGAGRGDVYKMSWEDYQALTDQQRAAVDFNTMLVKAVRADRRNQDSYANVADRSAYDAQVEKIFGADGGSELYAPQTVALLRQIDFTDPNADLDQFLKLRAAITDKDLKGLALEGVPGIGDAVQAQLGPAASARNDYVASVSSSVETKMDEIMAKTPTLLSTPMATMAAARGDALSWYGVQGVPGNQPPGWGDPNADLGGGVLNSDFQAAYEGLANTAFTPELQSQLWERMRQSFTPEQQRAFMDYATARTKQSIEYGRPLGSDTAVQYRDPQEMLKLLGQK